MTYAILAIVGLVQCILWLGKAQDASAYELSGPAEGVVSALDGVTSRFMLARVLNVLIVKTTREARTFTAGAILGLVVIFAVYYSRSPWRKLPPRPRGLPLIGNALQVMDTKWLISKDCKDRFGEYPHLSTQGEC